MAKEILALQGLSKYYTGPQSVVIGLDRVDLSFQMGEFVAITGESGSGKSTLAHVLGGILPYEAGELLVEGKPTSHYDGSDWERYRRDKISFISQSYGILSGSTVLSNVVSALRLSGMTSREARAEAEIILRRVELWDMKNRRAAKLSSGQKQRLSIARALAKPAPILLADEPTGNLDEENSAKVISLLADAAKERLVILITHEFSEVESFATRRICLQDGAVTMDARLRPAAEVELSSPPARKKQRLGAYIAGLQLRSQPVWSAMMLLFFALTAFAVFAFLGTFIVALDDTPTRIYDNSAFQNGNPCRVVVTRADGGTLTQEDADGLLELEYVQSLERYGYLRDIGCFHIPETHYHVQAELVNIGSKLDPIFEKTNVLMLRSTSDYLQTVPLMPEDSTFLTGGRLPATTYEVVAVGGEDLIGTEKTVYIRNEKDWNSKVEITLEVTVVGVTDYGSGLYFHEDLGRMFNCLPSQGLPAHGYPYYLPNASITDDSAFFCTPTWYEDLAGLSNRFLNYRKTEGKSFENMTREDYESLTIELYCTGSHNSSYPYLQEVSPATFDTLVPDDWGNQFSLAIEDYAYTDRVIASVKALGYEAVSPFREGSARIDPDKAAERKQTLWICLLALIVIFALQIIVLKAMFGMKHESYKLLSNIGLDCRSAKGSILLQLLLFTVLGQALGFCGIAAGARLGINQIVNLTRYLPALYALILCAVHLLATGISALWIMRGLRKQVYPFTAVKPDLALSEEVEV